MSKEYDIDNAISYALIYEIDSCVTPMLMLWGQLNLGVTMSRLLAKPLNSDHALRAWFPVINGRRVDVSVGYRIQKSELNPKFSR